MAEIKEKETIHFEFSGTFIYVLDNKGKFTKGQALDSALMEWEKVKEKMGLLGVVGILTKEDIIIIIIGIPKRDDIMLDINEKECTHLNFSGTYIYSLDNKGKFTKGQALDIALREWEKTKEKMYELGIVGILTKEDIIVKK